MFLARDGVTICLQRDPFPQFAFPNEFEAYDTYPHWGRAVLEQEELPDLAWDIMRIQLTHDTDTNLISVGGPGLDWQTLWTVAHRFATGQGTVRLHVASEMPARLTFCGAPIHQMVFCAADRPARDEMVVFLNLRGIGQDGRAIILENRRFADDELAVALGINVADVPGFSILCSGGQRHGHHRTFQNGDVISPRYVPDADLAASESSESERSRPSSSDDGNDHDIRHASDHESPPDCCRHQVDSQEPHANLPASSAMRLCSAVDNERAFTAHTQHKEVMSSVSPCTWNCAECKQDAWMNGQHGDTPTGETVLPSSSHCCCEFGAPCNHGRREKHDCSVSRGGSISLKVGLFGLVLYCQSVNAVGVPIAETGGKVILPILDFVSASLPPESCDNGRHDDLGVAMSGIGKVEVPGLFAGPPSADDHFGELYCSTAAVADDDDLAFLHKMHISTTLDVAKGDPFRRTRSELYLFFSSFIGTAIWHTQIDATLCSRYTTPWLSLRGQVPLGAHLHEHAAAALQILPQQPQACTHIEIYTDGWEVFIVGGGKFVHQR